MEKAIGFLRLLFCIDQNDIINVLIYTLVFSLEK